MLITDDMKQIESGCDRLQYVKEKTEIIQINTTIVGNAALSVKWPKG
jgi:hypothetical protein